MYVYMRISIRLVILLSILLMNNLFLMHHFLFAQNIERLLSFQELKDFAQTVSPYFVRIERESVLKENYHRPGDLKEWGYGLFIQGQGVLTYQGWLEKKIDEADVLIYLLLDTDQNSNPKNSNPKNSNPKSLKTQIKKRDLDLGLALLDFESMKEPIYPNQMLQNPKDQMFFGQPSMALQEKQKSLLQLLKVSTDPLWMNEILYVYQAQDQPMQKITVIGKAKDFWAYYHLCFCRLPYGLVLLSANGMIKGVSAGPHPLLKGYSLILPPQAVRGFLE
jgi:hypothetical protein